MGLIPAAVMENFPVVKQSVSGLCRIFKGMLALNVCMYTTRCSTFCLSENKYGLGTLGS